MFLSDTNRLKNLIAFNLKLLLDAGGRIFNEPSSSEDAAIMPFPSTAGVRQLLMMGTRYRTRASEIL